MAVTRRVVQEVPGTRRAHLTVPGTLLVLAVALGTPRAALEVLDTRTVGLGTHPVVAEGTPWVTGTPAVEIDIRLVETDTRLVAIDILQRGQGIDTQLGVIGK